MTYRADIDGLRTIAVLLVLIFHFDLFMLGKAGFIGVDVFFVISGFLITSIIRSDLETGRFHFGGFLYRRIRRLYPALMTVIMLTLLAGWVLFLPYRYADLATETLWSLLYVVNIYFWQNISYFALQADAVPLLHMWSLAVEEQFYFFFPLACLAIWRWGPRLLLPAVVLVMLASFLLGVVATPLKPEAAFYLLPTRAWELLLGAALALFVHTKQPRGVWLQTMGPAGLILIVASIVFYGPLTQIPGWFALLPTLGAAALILGGFDPAAPVTRLLSLDPIVWIGKISYPLYLVHWPIRIFLREHVVEFTLGWRFLGFLLSFVVAAAIYYLIETPIRRGRILNTPRVYLATVASVSLAALIGSWLIVQRDGLPSRFTPQVAELLEFRNDTPTPFLGCEYSGSQTTVGQFCKLGVADAPREVLVIGDSHAQALAGALDQYLAGENRGGALVFHHGCMPVLEAGKDKCRKRIKAALRLAKHDPQVTEVVLVSIWRQALPEGGKPYGGRWVPEGEAAEAFETQLAKTVEFLRESGKKVTIIEPLFAARRSVPDTLAANIAYDRNWPVDVELADYRSTFETVFAAFDRVDGVRRISLIDRFCRGGVCRATIDGQPLFTDNNHLAFRHSKLIAKELAKDEPRGGG